MTQIQNYLKLMKVKVTPGKVLHQMKTVHLGRRLMVKTDSNGQQKSLSAESECHSIT
jgi:hypothetical protein